MYLLSFCQVPSPTYTPVLVHGAIIPFGSSLLISLYWVFICFVLYCQPSRVFSLGTVFLSTNCRLSSSMLSLSYTCPTVSCFASVFSPSVALLRSPVSGSPLSTSWLVPSDFVPSPVSSSLYHLSMGTILQQCTLN